MCFPYLSTTIRINGATHVLKLKHLPWSRQSDFFHKRAWGRVTISFKEKKKHWMNASPAFADPYACTQLTQPFLGLFVSVKLCTRIRYLQTRTL